MRRPTGGDETLLQDLERALTPPTVPTTADRDALRAHVLAARSIDRHGGWVAIRRRSAPRRRAAAAVAVAVALGAVLYSATNPLPRPVRIVAHAIGLPVASPDLVDARERVTDLRDAITAGDRQQIADRAADLRDQLRALHRDDRAAIEDEADAALADADHWLATRAAPRNEHPVEPEEPPHTAPETPTAPVPSTPSTGGDHQGDEPDQHPQLEPPDPTTTTTVPGADDHSTPSTTHMGEAEPSNHG